MLEIMIPRDIREFETKFIGQFTFRQAVAFTIVGIIAYIGVFIQKNILGLTSTNYLVLIPFGAIPVAFGYGKQLVGMELEIYLQMVFINMFMTPKHRPYRTHSYYTSLMSKKEKDAQRKKEKSLKNVPPELVAYD